MKIKKEIGICVECGKKSEYLTKGLCPDCKFKDVLLTGLKTEGLEHILFCMNLIRANAKRMSKGTIEITCKTLNVKYNAKKKYFYLGDK